MKKVLGILVALCLISSQAFAAPVYTVTSTEKYRDVQGNNKIRVQGTIAFDSAYNCNATTKVCGEAITPAVLGLSSISRMSISPDFATAVGVAGGLVFFRYHTEGFTDNGVAGLEGPNVRMYIYGNITAGGLPFASGPLVSSPSYNLSALTAVPFEAIGA
jgi:hypothetical protein